MCAFTPSAATDHASRRRVCGSGTRLEKRASSLAASRSPGKRSAPGVGRRSRVRCAYPGYELALSGCADVWTAMARCWTAGGVAFGGTLRAMDGAEELHG